MRAGEATMRLIHPRICKESEARASANRHYNFASVAIVRYKGRVYTLETGHGDGDDEYYWQEGRHVYALAVGHGIGYCGLSCFELGETPNEFVPKPNRFDADKVGEVFLQVDHEIESALGTRGIDLAPATIRRRLMEYLA